MIISEPDTCISQYCGKATWYEDNGGVPGLPLAKSPTPGTTTVGRQYWWVTYTVVHKDADNISCVSEYVQGWAEVLELSPPPKFQDKHSLCQNQTEVVIKAEVTEGTDATTPIKWYTWDDTRNQYRLYQTVPQIPISTGKAETQIFYVTQTQTEAGRCESLKELGKVTVSITEVASLEDINLVYDATLCPQRSTVIRVTPNTVKPNAKFRWYTLPDKSDTIFVNGVPYEGADFETPILDSNVSYYVSYQYDGVCETTNAKSVVIYVGDNERPTIDFFEQDKSIVVSNDEGLCSATVQFIRPNVSDKCTASEDLKVYLDPPYLLENYFAVGDTTLTWWAEDETGNKHYTLQSIVVRDREKPKGTCPADIYWNINENETAARVFYTLDYFDNCDSLNLTYFQDRGEPSGSIFPLGEHFIRHLITDKAGNEDTCQFKIIVQHPYRPLNVELNISNNILCPFEELIIEPVVTGGTERNTFSWKPRTTWTGSILREYPPTGKTTYEVTVDDGRERITKSVEITVLPRQDVTLTLIGRPMDQIFEGDEVCVSATPGFLNYKLLLNNQINKIGLDNSVYFFAELGTFPVQVFATDANGCVAQDYMVVNVECKILPNIFTPNLDEINDVFLEDFLGEHDSLEVFNRAGLLIYSGYKGWDGYYKGKLMPQGTYLYVVRRKMMSGEEQGKYRTYKGTVTLKR
jgi:gliding motility-associated-like protein